MLPRQSAHGSTSESISNPTSHNSQTLNMLCHFGKCRKKKGDVSKGPSCDHPGSAFWLREKRITHGKYGILVRDRWHRSFGQEIRAIEARVA